MLGRQGFSLIELMVVVGITGIVTLGTMSTLEFSEKSNSHSRAVASVIDTMSTMRMALAQKDACTAAITRSGALANSSATYNDANPDATNFSLNSLAIGSATNPRPLFVVGEKVPGENGLVLQNAKIGGLRDLSPTTAPGTVFLGKLQLTIRKVADKLGGDTMYRETPILLYTSLTGASVTVTGCSASSDESAADTAQVCAAIGTTFDVTTDSCVANIDASAMCAKISGATYDANTGLCSPAAATTLPGAGGSTLDLIGGMHSSEQCASAGGMVYDMGGTFGKLCKFAGSSCAGGFLKYQNWSTTTGYFCDPNSAVRDCVVGGHGFSDNPVESCNPGNSGRNTMPKSYTIISRVAQASIRGGPVVYSHTCYATVDEVGCY